MARISQVFESASTNLGIAVLTPEYEIVLALLDQPYLTADQLLDRSSLSRAGFFNTTGRLKACKVLTVRSGTRDRRQRIYELSADLRLLIYHRFRKYQTDYLEFIDGGGVSDTFINKQLTARRSEGLDYFTLEFKIIFYLFLAPDLSNATLLSLLDASRTRFQHCLQSLARNQQVTAATSTDKRVKLYNITNPVRLAMESLQSDLFGWLDACNESHRRLRLASSSG